MIEILYQITESMRRSKRYLDDLQDALIQVARKKKNPPQLPQIIEIRQGLHHYWGLVASFMQTECYQTVHKVALLRDAKGPSELIIAIQTLEVSAEKCSVKGKALLGQHEEFMRSFIPRCIYIHFPGSDAIIAGFTQACGALRAGLIDLLTLIEENRQVCATYRAMACTNYKPAISGEFIALGKEETPYMAQVNKTYTQLKSLSNDIMVMEVRKKVGCIIM